jgi:hypothetical protein
MKQHTTAPIEGVGVVYVIAKPSNDAEYADRRDALGATAARRQNARTWLAPSPNATRRWKITRTGVTWSGWSIRAQGDREEHANARKLRSAFMATPTQKF